MFSPGLAQTFLPGASLVPAADLDIIPYLQVLDSHYRAVFANRGRELVQELAASVGDTGLNLLDAGFRLLPATAEFNLAALASLIAGEALLMLFETVERLDVALIAQSGEPCNAGVIPMALVAVGRGRAIFRCV